MTTNQAPAVTVYATSVLQAQSVILTEQQRTTLVAKADRFRAITGTTEPTNINVPIVCPRSGATLGYLTYRL